MTSDLQLDSARLLASDLFKNSTLTLSPTSSSEVKMVQNNYNNAASTSRNEASGNSNSYHMNGNAYAPSDKPTYRMQHLATFKVKSESEMRNPREKLQILFDLDKTGGVWPQGMYMCFNEQWLQMLDSDMNEIENFPGSLIQEPTAFISEDPNEPYNNILIFSVTGISLNNTEMHVFQVDDVSAVHLVEDLKQMSNGIIVTVDRNKQPIKVKKQDRRIHSNKDQYGIAEAAAAKAAEKNSIDRVQTERDILVINHCFEDVERFISRLRFAAEAIQELDSRQNEHNPHGEGLLVVRSRPPIPSEFQDILAKIKLTLIYIVKLQNHFQNVSEPVHHVFTSLRTIINVCNDVYGDANIPENVMHPLLRRETISFLNSTLNSGEIELWRSLGENWILPKDQFPDPKASFHPIFYNDWSPDWVVDDEVPYLPPAIKKATTPSPKLSNNVTWLSRLKSRNVKIAEVIFDKTGHNDKELDVTKGEFLEIIDDSRNWWKARNSAGRIGYVPNTILSPYNFEIQQHSNHMARETESLASSTFEQDPNHNNATYSNRSTISSYAQTTNDMEVQTAPQSTAIKPSMGRSYSMPPVPPPMPPPSDSEPSTPSSTLPRNTIMGTPTPIVAMRARNDDILGPQNDEFNEELRHTLILRERRKDLEILKTPHIYISQHSTPKEVENWLRGKGFSDKIINKLRCLTGEELFALSPHVIEGYFGREESRRLISQIVLQKNISEYKTVRSSELSAKLAKARQKVDQMGNESNEVF